MEIIKRENIDYLDKILLDDKGLYKAVPLEVLSNIPRNHLVIFANDNAIFQFVTTEMIDWLKEQIGDMKALEICAGSGTISRTLGIVGTDSRIQQTTEFKKAMLEKFGPLMAGLVLTDPPADIKTYESLEAVNVFRPDVVIGAYVTELATLSDLDSGISHGSHWGTNERELLKKVKKYIHFGSKSAHVQKFIYALPHQELHFPWLVTRQNDQSLNRVWIWENKI